MRSAEVLSIGRGDPLFASTFSKSLLNPEQQTPASLVGAHGKAADKRYNVYRNNVTVSLIEALAAIFPATQRITGPDFFRAMARLHIRETPPTSPLLFEYGHHFPAFIDAYEYAQPMPWLGDVARLERAWLDAYHAADCPVISADDLSAVAPHELSELRFRAHPATRILSSKFPAVTIFVANRGSEPVERIECVVPEDALITRPELDVVVRLLQPGGASFLICLADGGSLGSAAAAALNVNPAFDLAGMIAEMIEAGAFTEIYVENSDVENT
ncbi:DNA-binding domain-containing protein (plasmid) [Rhizobium sp. CB3171]|uniref:HvfC/BufC N-terminal domain-containing protein n=1 Tax=Rhizobium sp. CB3171 TaxID=3039157 RepID=UPI0024B0A53A|nr:DNA-binding domain-containing protein [Rhizobium sp. CB3171]WFU04301.1 DNA-binding domain-containing protein [Rhizobium sp. CB3171]